MTTFDFEGRVRFRSSKPGARGPAGEAELMRINPDRARELCRVAGWDRVESGSLNLRVEAWVVEELSKLRPAYFEASDRIRYPNGKSRIPELRGGYLYYHGEISKSGHAVSVLVRRAKDKPLNGLVEVYAAVSLKERFGLREQDTVMVTVCDPLTPPPVSVNRAGPPP